jgi:hypothetical protein
MHSTTVNRLLITALLSGRRLGPAAEAVSPAIQIAPRQTALPATAHYRSRLKRKAKRGNG